MNLNDTICRYLEETLGEPVTVHTGSSLSKQTAVVATCAGRTGSGLTADAALAKLLDELAAWGPVRRTRRRLWGAA